MTIIQKNYDQEKLESNEDELITYGEFLQAIKAVPDIFKNMLPRTLTLREVVEQTFSEEKF